MHLMVLRVMSQGRVGGVLVVLVDVGVCEGGVGYCKPITHCDIIIGLFYTA